MYEVDIGCKKKLSAKLQVDGFVRLPDGTNLVYFTNVQFIFILLQSIIPMVVKYENLDLNANIIIQIYMALTPCKHPLSALQTKNIMIKVSIKYNGK